MGYTHYWTVSEEKDIKKTMKLAGFVKQGIQEEYHVEFAGPMGDINTNPIINGECIRLNGLLDDSHETFSLQFGSGEWNFCKTNMKPYDTLVVATLLYAFELGLLKEWTSDGETEHLSAGHQLCNKIKEKLGF